MSGAVNAAGESPASRGVAQGWHRRALCRGQDPEIGYPIDAGEIAPIAICAAYPVRLDCRGWALEHNERDGIWGGLAARTLRRVSR
jgi:WhiB family redox-sensing transcriptional regulator